MCSQTSFFGCRAFELGDTVLSWHLALHPMRIVGLYKSVPATIGPLAFIAL